MLQKQLQLIYEFTRIKIQSWMFKWRKKDDLTQVVDPDAGWFEPRTQLMQLVDPVSA